MRFVYEIFASEENGHEYTLYRTDDDGGNRQVIEGAQPPSPPTVRRVSTYIEVSCDDSKDERERACEALRTLANQHVTPKVN